MLTELICSAALLDLDGTLVCTAFHSAFAAFAAAHPHLGEGAHLQRMSSGLKLPEFIRRIWPDCSDVAAAVAELGALQLQCPVTALPGAQQLVASLPLSRWGIFTSAEQRRANRALELTALVRPKVLICADDVNLGKPDPEGLLLGASLLGVDPCNGVYIGDAMPDILAARAAGMLCIGVGQDAKQLGADLTVDTLKHLSVGEMRSDGQFVIRVR